MAKAMWHPEAALKLPALTLTPAVGGSRVHYHAAEPAARIRRSSIALVIPTQKVNLVGPNSSSPARRRCRRRALRRRCNWLGRGRHLPYGVSWRSCAAVVGALAAHERLPHCAVLLLHMRQLCPQPLQQRPCGM
jgi:hypothetical protein